MNPFAKKPAKGDKKSMPMDKKAAGKKAPPFGKKAAPMPFKKGGKVC